MNDHTVEVRSRKADRKEGSAPLRWWLGRDAPTIVLASALFVVCYGLMAMKGIYFGPKIIILNAELYIAGIVIMLSGEILWRLYNYRPERPIAYLRQSFLAPQGRWNWVAGLPMLLTLMAFMPFYSKSKSMIPLFNTYDWDTTFIAWDRFLFFGNDAWQILQPLIGFPIVTSVISVFYQLWLLLIYPGCLYICFYSVDPEMRRRFFFSFILCWTVLGAALATHFASYGPCFIGPLLGNHHFDTQMAYLNATNERFPVMALPVQQLLLDWFHADARGLGSGITAMPSMHVSIAFLYFLAMRYVNRWAAMFFFAFFVTILIGSIHLAYHYAVDGIVSIVVTAMIWTASRWFFRIWDAYRAQAPV